jgi:uncharacterized protein (DUF1697 family)
MTKFAVLLRGINVGGKNPVPMSALRDCLGALGYANVSTYIASGNVILESANKGDAVAAEIEKTLPVAFKLHSDLIRVLALTGKQLQSVIDNRPPGFGDQPDKYHSDAIFLMGITAAEAMAVFQPREGVDRIWPGKGVIYSQRLSAERTKSRLGKIVGTPAYASMTIRNWATTTKLLKLVEA